MQDLLKPVLISMLAGSLIYFIPKRFKKVIRFFSFITAVYLFAAAIKIFLMPDTDAGFLYLDALSRFIVLGIGFFGVLVALYSGKAMQGYKDIAAYYTYILWTIGCSMLVVLANNIVVLIAGWGFLGLLLYLLINVSSENSLAPSTAKKALIIVGGTDSLMIMGFGLTWFLTNSLYLSQMKIHITGTVPFLAFWLIAVAVFAKAGAMPFHTWIPDMAESSNAAATAFLPASIDKLLGIYLLARLVFNVFVMDVVSNSLLMLIGALTIIFAVMMALVQHDIKRLLGYHAVSQVGYMVLGIGTANPLGMAGALFHMLNHAIYKCSLFLSAGNVEYKTKESELDNLGGLAKVMPVTFIGMLFSAFAISGIPPFNGFVSKWMIYQGLAERIKTGGVLPVFCLILAMFGSGLTLASFIKLIHGIFLTPSRQGDSNKADVKIKEVSFQMWLPAAILAGLCLIFGVFSYSIPLKYFIAPVFSDGLNFTGQWQPLKATLFLFIGLGLGLVIYLFGNFKAFRRSSVYIGGGELDRDMRLSGTEFYNTIREYGILKFIYKLAEKKLFDIYELGRNSVLAFTKIFQYLHNGVLSTYVVWFLLGMIFLFFKLGK